MTCPAAALPLGHPPPSRPGPRDAMCGHRLPWGKFWPAGPALSTTLLPVLPTLSAGLLLRQELKAQAGSVALPGHAAWKQQSQDGDPALALDAGH